jgi:putative flavoprotein involved in K+ transport
VTHYDTIVIGAGQAGLAAGYFLRAAGLSFTILEASDAPGAAWTRRWDSLRLFTPARYSGLPGMPFPGGPDELPTREQVVRYLRAYADRFKLPVRTNSPVAMLNNAAGQFVVHCAGTMLTAERVIVATGAYQRPFVPGVSSRIGAGVVQIHSSEYRSPSQLPPGDVLVVGAGNSGTQIAMELAATRRVWLSGRDTGAIPRRLLGRDVYRWLWPTLLRTRVTSWLGRRLTAGGLFAGDPLVGITAADIARSGVTRVGRTTDAIDGRPLTEDRSPLDVSAIVWCTGFRPNFDWIRLPVFDSNGYPRHQRGLVDDVPGLAFVGLRRQYRLRSSLLGGVGGDAAWVVANLRSRAKLGEMPRGINSRHTR